LSTGQLRLLPGRVEIELTFAQADVQALTPLDTNGDGRISPIEWTAAQASLRALVRENLRAEASGHTMFATDVSTRHDASNNVHFAATFPLPDAGRLTFHSELFSRLPRGHRQFITVIDATGRGLSELLLSAEQTAVTVTMETPSRGRAEQVATFGGFLALGLDHIITGYDHLLFLFALLLLAPGFRQAAGIITSFTVAHSITLGLATLDMVRLSPRFVEPLIAASIVYVGIENLICRDGPRGRWLLTFAFGLVHGFGFAGVLRELGVSSGSTGIAMPLLAFNLGVETGQIAIAALVLPLLWWARQDRRFICRVVPLCSAGVIALGAWWFVGRTVL
jgi:hydrogenase/urease accessory protein HupE